MTDTTIVMTENQLRLVVRQSVLETLVSLGMDVDIEDPSTLIELQADFRHVRQFRKSTEAIRKHVLLTTAASAVTGAIALLWLGIQSAFQPFNH